MFCHNLLGLSQMLGSIDVFYFQACSAIFTLLPAHQLMGSCHLSLFNTTTQALHSKWFTSLNSLLEMQKQRLPMSDLCFTE